ncbi:pyrroline-5-carboxylate reductase [Tessaracoccus sp. Z1128]
MKLTLIGAGAMGEALLAGWLAAGRLPEELSIVEPAEERAAAIQARHGVRAVALQDAAAADVVVLAVKPHQIPDVLAALTPQLEGGQLSPLVVSIAAGTPVAQLEAGLPDGTAVVRVMPNTPALVGQGMAGVVSGTWATAEQLDLVASLMDAVGRSMVIPESQIDALTAVSGSGPAYLFYVADAMIEAGVHQGLTRAQATDLVVQTFVGSASLLATGTRPGELREQVTSPAGTTAAALRVLDERAVRAAFLAAMEACADRGRAMAR